MTKFRVFAGALTLALTAGCTPKPRPQPAVSGQPPSPSASSQLGEQPDADVVSLPAIRRPRPPARLTFETHPCFKGVRVAQAEHPGTGNISLTLQLDYTDPRPDEQWVVASDLVRNFSLSGGGGEKRGCAAVRARGLTCNYSNYLGQPTLSLGGPPKRLQRVAEEVLVAMQELAFEEKRVRRIVESVYSKDKWDDETRINLLVQMAFQDLKVDGSYADSPTKLGQSALKRLWQKRRQELLRGKRLRLSAVGDYSLQDVKNALSNGMKGWTGKACHGESFVQPHIAAGKTFVALEPRSKDAYLVTVQSP